MNLPIVKLKDNERIESFMDYGNPVIHQLTIKEYGKMFGALPIKNY